jgi:hypothetical protein
MQIRSTQQPSINNHTGTSKQVASSEPSAAQEPKDAFESRPPSMLSVGLTTAAIVGLNGLAGARGGIIGAAVGTGATAAVSYGADIGEPAGNTALAAFGGIAGAVWGPAGALVAAGAGGLAGAAFFKMVAG